MSHPIVTSRTTRHEQLTDAVEQLVERTARSRGVHGLVLGVQLDDGSPTVRAAAGELHARDSYYVASITKMCTASVIFQLIDEGRLTLDDRVEPLLPDLDLAGLHVHRGVDATDRLAHKATRGWNRAIRVGRIV